MPMPGRGVSPPGAWRTRGGNEKDFPNFKKKYGPRGVLHCWADGKGGQKFENTGPLTKKRMETCDDEFLAAAK